MNNKITNMDQEYVNTHEDSFRYLFELQSSGITNMFGAAPFLSKAMGLSKDESREILRHWMDNYDEIANYLHIEVNSSWSAY